MLNSSPKYCQHGGARHQIVIIYTNNNNAGVRLFGHLIATLSFMPHAGQSSGNCQKYIQYDLLKSYSFRGGAYDSETARRTFFILMSMISRNL